MAMVADRLTSASRRGVLACAASIVACSTVAASRETKDAKSVAPSGRVDFVITSDGAQIVYKDWGAKSPQPIVFHHGWPFSSDDWETQMLFFLSKGYRVIAHDRRGHGRSDPVSEGHDMDRYAEDVAAVVEQLDLRNAIHVGHSTGGGEAARYVARHGGRPRGEAGSHRRRAAADAKDGGQSRRPAASRRSTICGRNSQRTAPSSTSISPAGRSTASTAQAPKPSKAVIWNWWRQGMTGSAKAHYDGVKAFSQTDFTEDLKAIAAPTLVLHGGDDQIVPVAASAPLSARIAPAERPQNLRRPSSRGLHDPRRHRQRRDPLVHLRLTASDRSPLLAFQSRNPRHANCYSRRRLCRHVRGARRSAPARGQRRLAEGFGDRPVAPEPRLVIRPRLYEARPETLTAPLGDVLAAIDVAYVRATAEAVDVGARKVEIVASSGAKEILTFDRLVLATGSRLLRPEIPGLAEHGFSVDGLDDAIALDRHLHTLSNQPPGSAREAVVVIGGGFTGIETATEMPARLREILGDQAKPRVILVDRSPTIAPDMGESARRVVRRP